MTQNLQLMLDLKTLLEQGEDTISMLQKMAVMKGIAFDSTDVKQFSKQQGLYNNQLIDTDKRLKAISKINTGNSTYVNKTKLLVKLQQELTDKLSDYISKGKDLSEVTKNLSKVEDALSDLKKEQEAVNKSTNKQTSVFSVFFKKLAGIGIFLKVIEFFKTGAQKAAELDDALASLSSITGLTGDDLDGLKEKSKKLALELNVTSVAVVEGMQLIGSAKPDLLGNADALAEVTRQAIILSKAAKIDMVAASDAIGSSLNQFSEGADQASRYINVLAAGAQKGASLINETAAALKNSGTVAAAVGASYEETNAAIQVLAKVSVKGGEAGTGLRNVLLKLATQADEYNPKVVGLTTALDNLGKKQLTTTELSKLFGDSNVVVAQQLINNASEVANLTQELTGTDTAYVQAKTNGESFNATLIGLKNATGELAADLTEALLPALKKVTSYATTAVKYVGELVSQYRDWSKSGSEVKDTINELNLSLSKGDVSKYISRVDLGLLNDFNKNVKDLSSSLNDASPEELAKKMDKLYDSQERLMNSDNYSDNVKAVGFEILEKAIKKVGDAYDNLSEDVESLDGSEANVKVTADIAPARNTIRAFREELDSLKNQRIDLDVNSPEYADVTAKMVALQSKLSQLNKKGNSERVATSESSEREREKLVQQRIKNEEDYSNKVLKIEELLSVEKKAIIDAYNLAVAEGDEFKALERSRDLQLANIKELEDALKRQLAEQVVYSRLNAQEIAKMSDQEVELLISKQQQIISLEEDQNTQLGILRSQAITEYARQLKELNSAKTQEVFEGEFDTLEKERLLNESKISIKQDFYDESNNLIEGQQKVQEARNKEVLENERQFVVKQIALYEALTISQKGSLGLDEASYETAVNNLKAAVAAIDAEIANGFDSDGTADLFTLLGLDISDEDKGKVQNALSDVLSDLSKSVQDGAKDFLAAGNALADAIQNGLSLDNFQAMGAGITGVFSAVYDGMIGKQDEYIASLDKMISSAEASLSKEQDRYEQQVASYLDVEKNNLSALEAERKKAVQKREEYVKKQNALDSLATASSLGLAVANTFKVNSGIPLVGIAVATIAVAAMLTYFKNQKSKIQRLKDGTPFVENLSGKKGTDTEEAMLDVGERVIPKNRNKKYWDLYEGVRTRNLTQFVKGVSEVLASHKKVLHPSIIEGSTNGVSIQMPERHIIKTEVQKGIAKEADNSARDYYLEKLLSSNERVEKYAQSNYEINKRKPTPLPDGSLMTIDERGNRTRVDF